MFKITAGLRGLEELVLVKLLSLYLFLSFSHFPQAGSPHGCLGAYLKHDSFRTLELLLWQLEQKQKLSLED